MAKKINWEKITVDFYKELCYIADWGDDDNENLQRHVKSDNPEEMINWFKNKIENDSN